MIQFFNTPLRDAAFERERASTRRFATALGFAWMMVATDVSASNDASAPRRQDDVSLTGAPTTHERHWYGWQTLIVDGASAANLGTAAVLFAHQGRKETVPPQVTFWVGFSGAMLGAPIVHWAHGHVGKGFGSMGVRMGVLVLAVLSGPESSGSEGAAIAVAGLVGASALDAAWLAYEPESRPRASSSWQLAPLVGRRSAGLSLRASF
jgi:hypothetical protein